MPINKKKKKKKNNTSFPDDLQRLNSLYSKHVVLLIDAQLSSNHICHLTLYTAEMFLTIKLRTYAEMNCLK